MLRAGGVRVWCLACLLLWASRSDATEAFFDYLYIEASSGSSAGGHAAVRFGDDVYHFQYDRPGVIRAAMQPWRSFDLSYRGLENRPIHVQRIAVSPATYHRLRSGFHQRYVVQESHVHLLDALRRERELLACLAEPVRDPLPPCEVRLPGAGYFFAARRDTVDSDGRPLPSASSILGAGAAAIEEARRHVERVYAYGYLDRRMDELRAQIEALRPINDVVELPREGIVATQPTLFADRYGDLLLELLALRVLSGQAPARGPAFRVLPGTLTDTHRAWLERREARAQKSIVALVASSRADRGYPLVIALARLAALRASRESGRLIVLDTYADDAPTTGLDSVRRLPPLREIQEERWQETYGALATASAASIDDEASWSRFEVAANVAIELTDAMQDIRTLRAHQPALAPARGAQVQPEWPAPRLDTATAAAAMNRAQELERRIEQRLRTLYRYDLIRRNCVTEIFRTVDDTDGIDLGQRVDVDGNVNFIPFVSANAVRKSYPIAEHFVLPSYHEQQLRQLHASRDRWRTLLREETSLTSTVIPFSADDEAFLFFSNGTTLLRPLLGTANVAFGVGAILAGTLSAPFDRGTLFAAGARGVFYSLPEVAFVNIRKGTVPILPSTWDTASFAAAKPSDRRVSTPNTHDVPAND